MNKENNYHGVFALPVIPYFEDETLDEESFVNELNFCLKADVHGIAVPLESGEFYRLSDEERLTIAELTVETIDGNCPVVIGISATNIPLAVKFAKHAQEIGADAILSIPPYGGIVPFEYTIKYFQSIADVSNIPIILQNTKPPIGPTLSTDDLYKIVQSVKDIQYIKDETTPTGQRISSLLAKKGDLIKGIFGGLGGKFMLNELDRGSSGIMTSCQIIDIHMQIYENYINGNIKEAREIFHKILPLINLDGNGMWLQNAKTILMKRGIINNNIVRGQGKLDRKDQEDLEIAFENVKPLFRI